ncbi:oxidoreductase [Paraburkholderia strydomiana]|uniref:oxidoreductase n=1 Tax=Paraburkholderia strydomiana TaxID=1245417 RepID=UPI00285A12C7|nr:hypothetical protein [Paraburkholderia strydomiana]MDR7008960.1 2,4-dienoyl-CoA reductase-like NADH-dependent reductase (Old Yellow Enzyme family) [Paraburkholderia strydomiana]
MARSFCPGGVPTAEVAAYYRRRATHRVGLIISEGTGVGRAAALDDPNVRHVNGEAALAGWKKVVEDVHAAGARIAPRLWHVGNEHSNGAGERALSAYRYESPSVYL